MHAAYRRRRPCFLRRWPRPHVVNVKVVPRLLIALGTLAVGLGVGIAAGLLMRPGGRTTTVTRSTVEVVNGPRSAARRPAPLPTLVEGAIDPPLIPRSGAVPVDANVESGAYV